MTNDNKLSEYAEIIYQELNNNHPEIDTKAIIASTNSASKCFENELAATTLQRERYKIDNSEISSYDRFKALCLLEYNNFKKREDSFFTDDLENRPYKLTNIEDKLNYIAHLVSNTFFNNVTMFFENGFKFKLETEQLELIEQITSKTTYKNLPFDTIFIELNKSINSTTELFGLLIAKTLNTLNKKEALMHITSFCYDKKNHAYKCGFCSINEAGKHYEKAETTTILEEIELNQITNLACSILDFINHPEVELKIISMKDNNTKRIKENRLLLPNKIITKINGKLYKYIYEDIPKQKKEAKKYKFSFWVRGYSKTLTHSRYTKMLNNTIVIEPFVKGFGPLIEKEYSIGINDTKWTNEKILYHILQNLFFNHKIKRHYRKILNGLEIDCFLPELNVGFEYNGEQHYHFPNAFHKTEEDFKKQQEHDILKNKLAKEKNIKLITIKYDEELSENLILEKIKEVDNAK